MYQTRECFIGIYKHRENTTRSGVPLIDEIRVVWIADETLPLVFDVSSQSKQKLRRKRRSIIVKVYAD